VPILLKNDFSLWREEDFRRNIVPTQILIQELGLSDSEIPHFLRSSAMPATFSTVSATSGQGSI
jgi:hypothetical protein